MRLSIRTILTLAVGVLVYGQAAAQTGKSYITIEARVGAADAVYYGTLAEVIEAPPERPEVPPGDHSFHKLKIKVRETLKGPASKELMLAIHGAYPTVEILRAWVRDATPFLWCIGRPQPGVSIGVTRVAPPTPVVRPNSAWGVLRLGPTVPEQTRWLDQDEQVFSMDFRVLKNPEEILQVARAYAKKHPAAVDTVYLSIPHSVAALCAPNGDWNSFLTPVSSELETVAHRLITAPEGLVGRTQPARYGEAIPRDHVRLMEEAWLRMAGISALRHYKSERNIALLKTQLKDSFSLGMPISVMGPPKDRYAVREAAYNVLRGWGVDVAQPVLEANK